MLHCVAVYCNVLQCVAVCVEVCSICVAAYYSELHCVAVCCIVLQCLAVCCSVCLLKSSILLSHHTHRHEPWPPCTHLWVLQGVAIYGMCCSVLQCLVECVAACGAVRCSALQSVDCIIRPRPLYSSPQTFLLLSLLIHVLLFPYSVAPNSRSTLMTPSFLHSLARARGVRLACSMGAQRHE